MKTQKKESLPLETLSEAMTVSISWSKFDFGTSDLSIFIRNKPQLVYTESRNREGVVFSFFAI